MVSYKFLLWVGVIVISISVLIYFAGKFTAVLYSKCWKEATNPFRGANFRVSDGSLDLQINDQCLGKYVITTSQSECKGACNAADEPNDCSKKCTGDDKTFFIAVKKDIGTFQQIGEAFTNPVLVFQRSKDKSECFVLDCVKSGQTVEIKPEENTKTCVRYVISSTAGNDCEVKNEGTCQVIQ